MYCQAEVPDTSHIFVNVGLGFHAELTLVRAAPTRPLRARCPPTPAYLFAAPWMHARGTSLSSFNHVARLFPLLTL